VKAAEAGDDTPASSSPVTVAYNGIERTNGTTSTLNKALVTSAGKLLTTHVQPSQHVEYEFDFYGSGGTSCRTAATIPAGRAFISEQVEVDVFSVDSPNAYSIRTDGLYSSAEFSVFGDGSGYAGDCDEYVITAGEASGGTVGSVAVRLSTGFVVPSGYDLDFSLSGMGRRDLRIWLPRPLSRRATDAEHRQNADRHRGGASPSC
jgi:hypothetical protein